MEMLKQWFQKSICNRWSTWTAKWFDDVISHRYRAHVYECACNWHNQLIQVDGRKRSCKQCPRQCDANTSTSYFYRCGLFRRNRLLCAHKANNILMLIEWLCGRYRYGVLTSFQNLRLEKSCVYNRIRIHFQNKNSLHYISTILVSVSSSSIHDVIIAFHFHVRFSM